jgi:hypothetical protein
MKPAFEQLVKMLQEDTSVQFVGCNGSSLNIVTAVPLSTQRQAEYKQVLDRLDMLIAISSNAGGQEVLFCLSSIGYVAGGSAKGITFRRNPPGKTVIDTDLDSQNHRHGNSFKPISGCWYVYYSR